MKRAKFKMRNVAMIIACLATTTLFSACEAKQNRSNEKAITAFKFTAPSATGVINEAGKSIKVDVPAGTDAASLTPVIEVSPKATLNPASGVAQNFTNPVTYTVTAEDGSTAVYTVTVTATVVVAQHDPKLILPDGEAWLGGDDGIGAEVIMGAYIFKADGTYDYWTYVVGYEEDAVVQYGTWETFDGGDLYADELILNHNNYGNKKYTYTVSETTFTYRNAVTDLTTYTRGAIPWE